MENNLKQNKILAWHFVADDKKLRYGSDLTVEPGYIYTETDKELVLCEKGMHVSKSVYEALNYAPGSILCRVKVWGSVIEGEDKIVGRNREVLEMKDVSSELRLWGCWCVRRVWHLLTDERSRNAVEVAERFAIGKATKEDMDAAWDAAWAAARAAARDAAWAAARDAARAAARAAAWDAARAEQSKELEDRMVKLFGF